MSEDEIAGQHHRCNGCEPGQTLGDGERQGGLGCRSPWGRKELDTTERLHRHHLRVCSVRAPTSAASSFGAAFRPALSVESSLSTHRLIFVHFFFHFSENLFIRSCSELALCSEKG